MIQEARRKNTDKRVERRLKAIEMRALGQSLEDVGHACEYHPSYITTLVAKYRDGGLTAIVDNGCRRSAHKRIFVFSWGIPPKSYLEVS